MTSTDLFRDWRIGMIAGAALLHLTALAGAWVTMPDGGVETRLDRPIEASLMPAPSNDARNENSAPLAEEVVSPVIESTPATEDTAETVPPDAAAAEPAAPPEQSAESLPVQTAEESAPAPAPPNRTAALVPDVVTVTASEPSETVTAEPQAAPSEVVTPKPAAEKPKKVEEPKAAPPKKKVVETPARQKPEAARLARLDTTTQVRRAQQGGAGVMSDIGVADRANAGAALKKYDALLVAAVSSRVRAMGSIACQGGKRTSVAFSVSAAGHVGGVRLSGPSGDSALDRAAVAAVRGIAPPPPPAGAVMRVIPVQCPRF